MSPGATQPPRWRQPWLIGVAVLGLVWTLCAELDWVGPTLLEVTGPRTPCANFAAWMGVPGWVKRYVTHGRPGAYLAVLEPGPLSDGAPVEVVSRPDHDISVSDVLAAWFGDAGAGRRVLDSGILDDDEQRELERVVARGSGG